MNSFGAEFFRVYDRKLAAGEIQFSQLGISKEDFTRLCTEPAFAFGEAKAADLCSRMGLSPEESKRLMDACAK